MLSRSNYEQAYVDHCRQLVAEQSRSYRDLLAVAGDPGAGAAAAFEPRFCAGMVLAIDAMFMHRQRALEGGIGDEITLDHEAFSRLATSYFDEIERRFV